MALCKILFSLIILILPLSLNAGVPIATDSRIRTYLYNENEVFTILINFGFQTSIEFAEGEEIKTISEGNSSAWKLTPSGRRLFIKPYEDNIHTNMTVITNMRTYQFDIKSKSLNNTIDEELVYVIRFFYPDDDMDSIKPKIRQSVESSPIPQVKPFNFNYSLIGPDTIAPIAVFDDGINTFFEFDKSIPDIPQIALKVDKNITPLIPRQKGAYIIVNTVGGEFDITDGKDIVTVFNEGIKRQASI